MSVDLLPPPGEFRTTEEIRDAKFAAKLARRRKLMLLWSAPVVLIAFLAALKLLSAVLLNMAGTSAYEKQNYVTATDRFESLEFFNVIEPWKAPFNQGTAVYATGDFFTATTHLEVALGQVPTAPEGEPRGEEECMVRTNYSLALEGLGDEAMVASDFAMASDYYDQAQTMLADCGESGGNGGEQSQEAEERQQQSQEESEQQQEQQEQQQGEGEEGEEGENEGESESPSDGESGGESESPSDGESGGESESPSDGESGGESESRDPRQEELEERNQEAQESREAAEQQSGGGDGSGQNW
ncbi:MAG TPA: MSCRAMM family adhesin SdrC [Candidatus Ruania gallistercoris]|uniref:MSCRAMM family adhesin SdrC n=1 Tax=Candidatus Ruania gallistercoris TaxID=2838746 RepID=A0A9D2J4V0_9MICO|nr:MSCRAMM family adhesin SdrC [Candidatus Ruania gallistercoris]